MDTAKQPAEASSRKVVVVISYAHGQARHEREVMALAEFLVSQDFEVIFDRWMGERRRQLDNWFLHEVRRCDYVLAMASERYKLAADGEAPPDDLRGAQSETLLLRDLLQGDRPTWEPRILPVVLPGQWVADIPAFLHPYVTTHYRVPRIDAKGAKDLLTVLTGPPAEPCWAPGSPRPPNLSNHDGRPRPDTAPPETVETEVVAVTRATLAFQAALGWLVHERAREDCGINLHVEIVEGHVGTGQLLGLHVKGGPSGFEEAGDSGWWYRPSLKHVRYWTNSPLPVVVVLAEPHAEKCYWQLVNDETLFKTRDRGWKLLVPQNQVLDESARQSLQDAAEGDPVSLDRYVAAGARETRPTRRLVLVAGAAAIVLLVTTPWSALSDKWRGDGTDSPTDAGTAESSVWEPDNPHSVAVDANGDVYVTLSEAGSVQLWRDGRVTPVVSRNGMLDAPSGLARFDERDLLVADSVHNAVRRITPDGLVQPFAGRSIGGWSGDGRAATGAELSGPIDVAVGRDGSVYIADTRNNRIRKVGPDLLISTVAGTGIAGFAGDEGPAVDAQLAGPRGVEIGDDGTLYVADTGNNRVRRIDERGTITTIAGSSGAGFGGDGGPAREAMLNRPVDIALDAGGRLYIADSLNNRVRQVDLAGTIRTVAGDGSGEQLAMGRPASESSLTLPSGVTFGPDGTLYIADTGNNRVCYLGPDRIMRALEVRG